MAALAASVVHPDLANAQQQRIFVQAAFTETNQTRPPASTGSLLGALGGTTPSGGITAGLWKAPRIALEGEVSFGGRYSSKYTYMPFPSRLVDVEPARRDTYLSFNVRTRASILQPVAGVGVDVSRISRHATFASSGRTYFDDAAWNYSLALVAGLDALVNVSSRASIVPTFRALVVLPWSTAFGPLVEQTRTGHVLLRYGAGVQVRF